MNTWFIRCNGETAHNQPGTSRYMVGEPPIYPERKFNYYDECLRKGFVRVGFPAAGDLSDSEWHTRAFAAYGNLMDDHHVRYLEQFVSIQVGDLVLMPTYHKRYEVYLGVVIRPRLGGSGVPDRAYYYHFNIPAGDWYDNAHRVDVQWLNDLNGSFRVFDIPEIGGTWLRAFGPVKAASPRILKIARDSGLVPK